jgi:hypothetical protein
MPEWPVGESNALFPRERRKKTWDVHNKKLP